MPIRVTKAVTKNGTYYATGDIIDDPSSVEESYRRLYGWETVADTVNFATMRKPELVESAEARGFDVSGLTKTELVDLLTE